MQRSNWRDCIEWKNEGFSFNTTSNEACKLYDVSLTQYISMHNDSRYGGLEKSIESMLLADPNFVAGIIFKIGVNCVSSPSSLRNFKNEISLVNEIREKESLTKFEQLHIDAINSINKGEILKACKLWDEILIEMPTDLMALKFLYNAYFHLGDFRLERRNAVASVLPFWNKFKIPLYEYVYGLYSFALAEENYLDEAKEYAYKSLNINPYDTWAVHSIAHVQDYRNQVDDGIKFLNETLSYWNTSFLSNHNYWHLSLHHLERGEFSRVLQIYDDYIYPEAKLFKTKFSIIDATSILYRLRMQNWDKSFEKELNTRWNSLSELCKDNIKNCDFIFANVHLLMGLNNQEDRDEFFKSIKKFCNESFENDENYFKAIDKSVGSSLYKAVMHFDKSEFDETIELLYPIRYEINKIGGSKAQQDLFHQILIQSAFSSKNTFYNKLGLKLLNEREALKPNSKLTERLAYSFENAHD